METKKRNTRQPVIPRLPITLSIIAAVLTIGLKSAAYALTGSAGLFSDALESGVNLLAAITAAFSLWYASLPADRNHTFGHEKIEYFSSGLEGGLICVAGIGTIWYAIERLIHPHELLKLEIGLVIAMAAALINFLTGWFLIRQGRKFQSIILLANGFHLMTDVYTSVGIVVGLIFTTITNWSWIDPIIALLVGLNITFTGVKLIAGSVNGLMDHALPEHEQNQLRDFIRAALPEDADFHALRTRRSGRRAFADFHLLLPGHTSVTDAHEISHKVEDAVRSAMPELTMTIHLEPIEDETSWEPELADLGEPTEPTGRSGNAT